ncbi:MBL fold metallo-hydrolase [Streptomyces roseolus]|uniref:MBL fold metallo-hydrolase n=2 Tax=Streptomyces roseolus TaxID=67358 RepID=UPI00362CA222
MTARFDHGAWAETGVETVHPGVHRVPLPLPQDGLHAVNVYVLEGMAEDGGLVMIDGGWAVPEARKTLEAALAGLGYDLSAVRDVFVTHAHRDHYTQAVELRRAFGARVHLGAGERRGLELLNDMRGGIGSALRTLRQAGAQELAARVRLTYPDLYDPGHWEEPDRWLGAETLRFGEHALRVIPTPGHTRGHVVFLDARRGLLFSGDHVLPRITPSIGFEAADPGGRPLASYLESLRLMTDHADTRLLPAHGPVGPSTHTRVAELVAHHGERLARTLAVLGDDTRDAFTVACALPWTRRALDFTELNPLNQMLAVNETVAHLDVLALRGKVAVSRVEGVDRYTRMR